MKKSIFLSIILIFNAQKAFSMGALMQVGRKVAQEATLFTASTAKQVYELALQGVNSFAVNNANKLPLHTASNSNVTDAVLNIMRIQGRNGAQEEIQALLNIENSTLSEIAYQEASAQQVAHIQETFLAPKFNNSIIQEPIMSSSYSPNFSANIAGAIAGFLGTMGIVSSLQENENSSENFSEKEVMIHTDDWVVQPPVQLFYQPDEKENADEMLYPCDMHDTDISSWQSEHNVSLPSCSQIQDTLCDAANYVGNAMDQGDFFEFQVLVNSIQ